MSRRLLNRADRLVRRIRPRTIFWSIVAIDLVLVALIVVSTLIPRSARLSVQAETDVLSVELPAGQRSFAWGSVPVDPKSVDGLPGDCSVPTLDMTAPLEGPLTMNARFVPATGLMSVALTRGGGKDVGSLRCADGRDLPSGDFIRLYWPKAEGRSLALRFMGRLTVGGDIPEGLSSLALLRNGTVSVEAVSQPFRNGSVRTESNLYAGDIVQFFNSSDNSRPTLAHGLVLLRGDGPMTVVAHAEAREAHVIHVGQDKASPASIAPTFWAKLQAQSEWTLILLLGTLLLNLVGALRSYREELAIEALPVNHDT